MESLQEIKLPRLAPCPWSDAVAGLLAPAFEAEAAPLEAARRRVEAGAASLLGVFDGPDLVGAVVFRVDGSTAVIQAAGGSWGGGSLVDSILPVMELGFKNSGLAFCRIETFRRGLMQKISGAGYVPVNVTFEKAL